LLIAMSKSGKTTLLSMLLAPRHQGGPLAGLAVEPGKTVCQAVVCAARHLRVACSDEHLR